MQQRRFQHSKANLGPDRLVRLSVAELNALRLFHSSTIEDASVLADYPHAKRAGVTEWLGWVGTLCVTIGWDWCQMSDGALLDLGLVSPRANVRLLDGQGYDMDRQQERQELASFIGRCCWRPGVSLALLALGQTLSHTPTFLPGSSYH